MTSVFTEATREIIRGGGDLAMRVDLVMIAALAFLLIEYDVLRVYFSRPALERLKPFGIAIAPLAISFVIVIASRWSQLR